jgi:hypothetical protein
MNFMKREGQRVFGSVTEEQLDLMTLEEVRMWSLARQQSVGSLVADEPNLEWGSTDGGKLETVGVCQERR